MYQDKEKRLSPRGARPCGDFIFFGLRFINGKKEKDKKQQAQERESNKNNLKNSGEEEQKSIKQNN